MLRPSRPILHGGASFQALVVPRVTQTQAAERNSLAPQVGLELTTHQLTANSAFLGEEDRVWHQSTDSAVKFRFLVLGVPGVRASF
jgi:hypothetical protein